MYTIILYYNVTDIWDFIFKLHFDISNGTSVHIKTVNNY